MKKSRSKPKDLAALRKKAEERLKGQMDRMEELSTWNMKKLVHEIGSYQIELEMQNEELLRAREELEESRSRYIDLYDFAPVGYFTLDTKGKIKEANLAGAALLGVNRTLLAKTFFSNFIHTDDLRSFFEHISAVLKKKTKQTCELKLRGKDGAVFFAHLQSIQSKDGPPGLIKTAVSDITDRKKTEEALRESEHRYRSLIELSPDAILVHAGGKYIYSNPAGLRLFGAENSDELLGKKVLDLVDPAYRDIVGEKIEQSYTRKTPTAKREAKILRLDGTPVVVEAISAPTASYGELATQVILRDVTERRNAEEELKKAKDELEIRVEHRTAQLKFLNKRLAAELSERKQAEKTVREQSDILDSLFKYTITPLVLLDRKFNFIRVNEAYARSCGKDLSEFEGRNHFEFYPHEENEAIFKEVIKTKTPFQAVARPFSFPDHPEWGVTYWDWTLTPLPDEKGDVQYLVFALQDVTERKKAEEELRKASLHARRLIEASLDPLVTINAGGKITDVNLATELATGVSREDIIGSDFSDYFTEPDKAREGYQKVFTKGYVKDYPLAIRHTSGRVMDVLYNATIYKNEAGEVEGAFAAARDLTEQKKTEEELAHHREHLEDLVKERTEQLEETNRYLGKEIAIRKQAEKELEELMEELKRSNADLQQFAYAASHDLQEPLRVVAGFVKLLEKRYQDKLDEKADEYIQYAIEGVKRMQMLIKDLLAFSQVGTKGKTFSPVNCSVALEQAIYNLHSAIEESGAEITYDLLPTLDGDLSQLTSLFQNLLGNAIKFRGRKRLKVHISAERKEAEWTFSVRDNGIGIDPKYAGRIFVIFQRLHTRDEYEGTGIGLAVCKKIVERHGGRMWVESEDGKGSTFFFTMPARE
jgi:PAS domain S-box-containing protein